MTSISRCGGHSGASATAASCGGAARVQAAAAVNVAALARTVHASAPAVAARAEHAGASTRLSVLKPKNEIVVQLVVDMDKLHETIGFSGSKR
jgi:hypothetical protein